MHAFPSALIEIQPALARRDTKIMEFRHDTGFLGHTIISLKPGLGQGSGPGIASSHWLLAMTETCNGFSETVYACRVSKARMSKL